MRPRSSECRIQFACVLAEICIAYCISIQNVGKMDGRLTYIGRIKMIANQEDACRIMKPEPLGCYVYSRIEQQNNYIAMVQGK